MKCIRIHTDRNHIGQRGVRRGLTPTHVGFKVQLVVEFSFYPLCLSRCQIQRCQNTRAGASEDVPPPPQVAVSSPCGKKLSICGSRLIGSSRPSSEPLPQVLEVHIGIGGTVLLSGFMSLKWLATGRGARGGVIADVIALQKYCRCLVHIISH